MEKEFELVKGLGEIWNDFLELEVGHPMERTEFCSGIHFLQDKLLARVGVRLMETQ